MGNNQKRTPVPPHGGRLQFLIVYPDREFAREATARFTRSGYASVTAATGDDALDIAIEQEPLVVLTETHVPGLNGYELCRVLRDAFGLGVAIAFVSGTRNEKPDVSAGLLARRRDYSSSRAIPANSSRARVAS